MNTAAASLALALHISLGLAQSSCVNVPPDRKSHFLQRTYPERRQSIAQYSPAEQVDFYLAAMNTHPPDLGLADAVAESGASVVPALLQRFESETSDITGDIAKVDLMVVFRRVHELSHYNLLADKRAMKVLTSGVKVMRDPFWQAMASENLESIRKGLGHRSP